jgi:hypothetical protein
MKYLVIVLILFLAGSMISAQEVVSSNGDSKSAAGVEVSWTVGEAVVATLIGGSNTLTQGFHQTKLTITAVSELLLPGIEIKVFPNPTQDFKLISSDDTEINMSKYASGQYILKLTNKSRQPLQTFQIIKY